MSLPLEPVDVDGGLPGATRSYGTERSSPFVPEAVESEDCRGRDLRLRPKSESIALDGGGGRGGGRDGRERSKTDGVNGRANLALPTIFTRSSCAVRASASAALSTAAVISAKLLYMAYLIRGSVERAKRCFI